MENFLIQFCSFVNLENVLEKGIETNKRQISCKY